MILDSVIKVKWLKLVYIVNHVPLIKLKTNTITEIITPNPFSYYVTGVYSVSQTVDN